MSTNGQITFIADGTAKRSYCHWDSYASGLGVTVLSWLREVVAANSEETVAEAARRLVTVSDGYGCPPPSPELRQRLAQYEDTNVGGPGERWYRLFRRTQGEPEKILAAGYAYDSNYDLPDAEDEYYNYVVDTDKRTFSALGHTWDWASLPSDAQFLATVNDE